MNAFDLLSELPITIEPNASIDQAVQRMEEHRIRHLPVVQDSEVLGMVSDRDILLVVGQEGHTERTAQEDPTTAGDANQPVPARIEQIMSAPVRTVGSGLNLDRIVELLISHKFSALPVVGDEGLLGVITKTDLLRWYGDFCRDHPTNPSAVCLVRSWMQHNLLTMQAGDPAVAAYQKMTRADIQHLPVLDGKKLVGVISDRDLRRAFGQTFRAIDGRSRSSNESREGAPVSTIMSPQPITAEPDQTMAQAVGLMLEHHVSALPVVTGGILVGIITSFDVLHLIRSLVVCAAA